jgi:hypothetical protein
VVRTIEVVTSVLALVAAGGAVAILVVFLSGDRLEFAHPIAGWAHRHRNALTFAIAGVSTLGSLYFSEVENFVPCRLCWFQRILMYPIALIALIALVRKDRNARYYTVPLAVIGASISLYHYLIEWDVLADSGSCTLFGPACAEIWFRQFGFVTLAFMALCGFVAIAVINLVPAPAGTDHPEELT